MEGIKKTTNRKLESYLYALGIKPITYEVLWDGMVQWTYRDDDAFRQAFDLYKSAKIRLYREKVKA